MMIDEPMVMPVPVEANSYSTGHSISIDMAVEEPINSWQNW